MYQILPDEVVTIIREEVKKARIEYEIVNEIIRNDILKILENQCTVLYYPLPGEEANGVHVTRYIKGQPRHFVFINTSNSLEKQVYTAAHELGHVWNVDKKVLQKCEEEYDSEDIINRFAAELLMPVKHFAFAIDERMQELGIAEKKTLTVEEYMPLTVYLMNAFMVPYKSVIYRYEELDCISEKAREILLNIERETPQIIEHYIKRGQFLNLHQTNERKSIGNLELLLREARDKQVYPLEKLNAISEMFGMGEVEEQDEDGGEIQIIVPRE